MTQELRVLKVLQAAQGSWVNGNQVFLREMMLTQYHRAIWNLQKKRNLYKYTGTIEASDFKDDFGFKSYRLVVPINSAVVERINNMPAFEKKPETHQKALLF